MKALRGGRAVPFILLHSFLVTAQSAIGTGGTNASSRSSPPFPIPANSSTVFTDSVTSTVLLGTGTSIFTGTVTETLSPSDTNAPLPGTSTESFLPFNSILNPTHKLSSSDLSSIPTGTVSPSLTNSSVVPTDSVTLSTRASSTAQDFNTESITNGPSSTNSGILPPRISETAASDGIILPPGITLPPNPSTTLYSTGSEIQSSASDLSMVIAGIFPLIQSWIDHPDALEITAVMNELNNVLPKATEFLGKLPKPTNGVEPCKSGRRHRSGPEPVANQILEKRGFLGNLFKTAFSLVTCVIDTTNKVKDGIIKGTTSAVETVKHLQDDLKPMVNALNEVDPNEDTKPSVSDSASEEPTSTQSKSSSSSSCTPQTVSNCNIGCTAIATTTLGGPSKRAEKNACTTVCKAPITRCGATGVTSVSTVTSTTTTYRICAQDCAGCNANNRKLPTDAPDLGKYSKASNGVLYLPAPTVTGLDDDTPAAETRELLPKETVPSNNLLKRGLTNPRDEDWQGDVDSWLLTQIALSPNNLAHGQAPITTTGFTFPLDNLPNTWSLINLYGCTSVIVISRKRMFMTHIWEGPTMVTPQNLQTQILDSLRYGDAGVPQGLTAFTGAGGDFENIPENKVRAFIITPYRRQAPANPSHNDLEYPYEVGKIQDLLKDVLGRTDTLIIPYVAMFPDPDLDYPFGKVLIQYDPVAAWLGRADGSCDTQVAGIELWFEANPMHRYRDRWFPFPNQILPMRTLPRRSNSGDGNEIRLLRGRKVTDADEEEWKEYESIMKRQGGGSCSLPSAPGESAPASSTSPPSSTGQTPTTLQTSFVSSSSEGGTTSPEELPPSTQEPPSSTKEQPSETSTPASDPTPTPTPSKAVSIIIRHVNDDDDYYNSWTFFETSVGSQADGCENPVLDDKATRWSDRDAINNPPWPHGTFTMTLFAEENCQYLNDGKGAGILHCPSMGEGNNVGCKEDAEKSQVSAITQCLYSLALSISYHRAVSCEY